MLEEVMMRAFLMLYQTDFEEGDDDRHPCKPRRSIHSERRAFTRLASVCSSWHLSLTGYPHSPTPHWVRHRLKKLIECKYFNMYVIVADKDCVDTDKDTNSSLH